MEFKNKSFMEEQHRLVTLVAIDESEVYCPVFLLTKDSLYFQSIFDVERYIESSSYTIKTAFSKKHLENYCILTSSGTIRDDVDITLFYLADYFGNDVMKNSVISKLQLDDMLFLLENTLDQSTRDHVIINILKSYDMRILIKSYPKFVHLITKTDDIYKKLETSLLSIGWCFDFSTKKARQINNTDLVYLTDRDGTISLNLHDCQVTRRKRDKYYKEVNFCSSIEQVQYFIKNTK